MPLSCRQTIVIDRVSSDVREYNLEVCPVSTGSKGMELKNGDKLFWLNDHVLKQCVDGTIVRWWHKPTMNEAVKYKDPSAMFDFKSDGSLKARLYGVEFYWSEPVNVEYSVGRPIESIQQNADGLWEESFEGDFNKMNLNH